LCWTPILYLFLIFFLCLILSYKKFKQFVAHKDWFYPLVVALVTSSSRSIRSLVQQILSGPLSRLVLLLPSSQS
jgi:hypothetical protein